MSEILIISIVLITLALIFYSIAVWAERTSRYLKIWHVVLFWIGLCFDFSGTYAMFQLSDAPFNLLDIHTLTGQIAIWLMFIHTIWATWVAKNASEHARKKFHRYSLIVWLIWLIPYFGGMFIGMKA